MFEYRGYAANREQAMAAKRVGSVVALPGIILWRPQFLSPTWCNNFPFPSRAPLTLLSFLSGWPEQAGVDFLILGLSFLLAPADLRGQRARR